VHASVLVSCLVLSAAIAQKPFTWQKQTSTFDYNAVSASGHSLDDFKLHQFWMMGASRTSVWRLAMPVIVGESIVAPGAYPILMKRTGETTAAIHVKSSGKAIGAAQDLEIAGPIGVTKKAAPKLVIGVTPDGEAKNGNQATKLEVFFGTNDWRANATFVGNKTSKVGAWTVAVWTVPAALFASRDKCAVPIATCSNGKDETWNLVLGKDRVTLVPAPRVDEQIVVEPTLDESRIVAGTIEALPAPEAAHEVLESTAATADKEAMTFDIVCGKEAVRLRVPLPKPKKGS